MDLVEVDFDIKTRHPWETARLKIVTRLISRFKRNHNLKILDVGSGDAFVANSFTSVFKNSEAHCIDIEYTDEIKSIIKSYYPNSSLKLHSNLNDVSNSNIFDIVTLLDVIEHVPNDVELLTSILNKEYISTETIFVITVPAYQKLFSQHDVLLKHYRRYNLNILKEAIDKSNMKFIYGGYFFTSLLLPRVVQLCKEKIKPQELNDLTNLGKWNKGSLISKLIESILLFDYFISKLFKRIGINLTGLSCYAICMKK